MVFLDFFKNIIKKPFKKLTILKITLKIIKIHLWYFKLCFYDFFPDARYEGWENKSLVEFFSSKS